MKFNLLTATILASAFALTSGANAAMTTDANGNVGYDSYDECVAAVKSGNTKFYTPYTYKKPKLNRGEVSIEKSTLQQVTIPSTYANDMPLRTSEYSAGACDRGVGTSNGRSGVSGVLVGKYVPFSSDMPVNVYKNSEGMPVRITMQQCDNHFSGKFPTPVTSELPAPPPQVRIEEDRSVEAVMMSETRTIRPSYSVKEIIIAPASQVSRVATADGSAIAVQDTLQSAVVLGEIASERVIEEASVPDSLPVTIVPDLSTTPVNNMPVKKVPVKTVPVTTISVN